MRAITTTTKTRAITGLLALVLSTLALASSPAAAQTGDCERFDVDFTLAELNTTERQVAAARQDDWSGWSGRILTGKVEISVFMIDGDGVQALLDAVDRPDLVEVRAIGIVGGFE